MPKIERKTQQIFCNSADSDQLAVFGSMATGTPVYSNDVEELQSNEAFQLGWDAATLEDKAPFMEEMNGLQYSITKQLAYIYQEGLPEWDAQTNYYIGAVVKVINEGIPLWYRSLTNDNVNNYPIDDSVNWREIPLTNSANIDLSNLTNEGQNIANWSTNVTNCLVEVPQRIKLELKNGVLTLKTGSCLIIPNGKNNDGSLKFDELITSKDYSWAYSGTAVGEGVPIGLDDGTGVYGLWARPTNVFSGTSEPSTGSVWYDTTNNVIKHRTNNTAAWTTTDASGNKYFLPFCIFTSASNAIDSVKKVFNGIGYIGSTFWFDKGVKVLIPNGRNTDGTLKNNEYTLDRVRLNTFASNFTNYAPIGLATWGAFYWGPQTYIGGERPSNPLNYTRWYNEEENWWYEYVNGWNKQTSCPTGYANVEKGVIKEFNPYTTLRAVDYNEYKPAIDSKVSKTGDTMTGQLVVNTTDSTPIVIKGMGGVDVTVNPSSTKYYGIQLEDINGVRMGRLEGIFNANGTIETSITANKTINGSIKYANFRVGVDANGKATYSHPQIISSYQNGTSGYNIWSNGYCEQWGVATLLNNDAINEITLLKSYKDTSYLVIANGHSNVATNVGGVDVFHSAPITNSIFNITWDYASNKQLGTANWIARGYIS